MQSVNDAVALGLVEIAPCRIEADVQVEAFPAARMSPEACCSTCGHSTSVSSRRRRALLCWRSQRRSWPIIIAASPGTPWANCRAALQHVSGNYGSTIRRLRRLTLKFSQESRWA